MKVAIDESPLISGHKVRGIGSYTDKLIQGLKLNPNVELVPFEGKNIPQADITHYTYFDLFFHTLPIDKKRPRVVTIHDVIPLLFPQHFPVGVRGYINLFFQKRALKNTDFVLCDSKTSKKDIVDKLSYPKDRIEVVYLAAAQNFKKLEEDKKLKSVQRKFNLPKDFALYVGDVSWNKNLPGLINSTKISKIPLVMVGSALADNKIPQTRQLDKQIKKLGLGDKIIKTGFISEDELIAIYNLAKVTALPSFYEGFGLTVLESMACGTPVVCSNNSSISEITGGQASYCDPQDPEDIAQKTLDLVNMPKSQMDKLQEKLILHAGSFTWQKTTRQTIEVYKKVIE